MNEAAKMKGFIEGTSTYTLRSWKREGIRQKNRAEYNTGTRSIDADGTSAIT